LILNDKKAWWVKTCLESIGYGKDENHSHLNWLHKELASPVLASYWHRLLSNPLPPPPLFEGFADNLYTYINLLK